MNGASTSTLSLAHMLPLNSENRWSDLLAVLVETDPSCVAQHLGLPVDEARVSVRREVAAGGRDRVDLVVDVDGVPHTVVEVKVLSGLGRRQLTRYRDATPDAVHHVLVFPETLVIDASHTDGWRSVTWEQLLTSFSTSTDGWVAQTAQAWMRHLAAAMPAVDPDTVWNDLNAGDDFVIALRARMSWVFIHIAPQGVVYDLVESSAGVSWIARMYTPAAEPGYYVLVEAEENLPVRDFPKRVSAASPAPRGPSIKVMLNQVDVNTSAGFNWEYLGAMWPVMAAARSDWVTNKPRMRAPHDREGWQRMVASGIPPHVGIGFGEAQTKVSRDCMFGARFQLAPTSTLQQVVDSMNATADLIVEMSRVPAPLARSAGDGA